MMCLFPYYYYYYYYILGYDKNLHLVVSKFVFHDFGHVGKKWSTMVQATHNSFKAFFFLIIIIIIIYYYYYYILFFAG